MFTHFRLSMAWLHTWFGLVLGFVLMVAFFFGSLSVFDREIDRWAMPATRIAAQPMPSYDRVLAPIFDGLRAHPDDMKATARRVIGPIPDKNTLEPGAWFAFTTHRDPVLNIGGEFLIPNEPVDPDDEHVHVHGWATLDPRDGSLLRDDQLKIGSGFFYPMHYSLHLGWRNVGIWIVGLAAMAMLAALVSGVVMHRKIFREFFTFRPRKSRQRSTLDLHNLTGVVALPFHFLWALSGLLIFAELYFPVLHETMRPLVKAQEAIEAKATGLDIEPSGIPGTMASVDRMVERAKAYWTEQGISGEVGYLQIQHVGQSNAYVSLYRDNAERIGLGPGLHFQASTGRLIHEDAPAKPVSAVSGFLTSMHLQQFRHWTLRWLIFMAGLTSCVCIATGFVFFVEKRKRQHAEQGRQLSRWVDALAVTTVTGMVTAALAMLVANRLLPEDIANRDIWEKSAFWGAWLLALGHAAVRSATVLEARLSPAWAEQCAAIAGLAVAAVVLNAATTGDHLLRTLSSGYWPVAGTDLVLLATAGVALVVRRRLQRPQGAGKPAAADEPVDGKKHLDAEHA